MARDGPMSAGRDGPGMGRPLLLSAAAHILALSAALQLGAASAAAPFREVVQVLIVDDTGGGVGTRDRPGERGGGSSRRGPERPPRPGVSTRAARSASPSADARTAASPPARVVGAPSPPASPASAPEPLPGGQTSAGARTATPPIVPEPPSVGPSSPPGAADLPPAGPPPPPGKAAQRASGPAPGIVADGAGTGSEDGAFRGGPAAIVGIDESVARDVRTPPAAGAARAGAAGGGAGIASVGAPRGDPNDGGGDRGGGGGDFSLLRERIQSRIVYPEEAIRRGQQGEVLLRLRVLPGGLPEDIVVARSSGARLLDEAARRGVARAVPLPSRPGWVEVPVLFRLR